MSYTRLTVIGSERKAELALPNSEPIGVLLPHVLELLEETPSGGAVLTPVNTWLIFPDRIADDTVEPYFPIVELGSRKRSHDSPSLPPS